MKSIPPTSYLQDASIERKAARYDLALENLNRFIKFDDGSSGELSKYEVLKFTRFVLELTTLALEYSPAEDYLNRLIERETETVFEETKSLASFRFLDACYQRLGSEECTVKLFEEIENQNPTLARLVFSTVRMTLLRKQKFEICSRYLTWETISESCVRPIQEVCAHPNVWLASRRTKKHLRDVSEYVRFLIHQNRKQDAIKLVEQIVSKAETPADWAPLKILVYGDGD